VDACRSGTDILAYAAPFDGTELSLVKTVVLGIRKSLSPFESNDFYQDTLIYHDKRHCSHRSIEGFCHHGGLTSIIPGQEPSRGQTPRLILNTLMPINTDNPLRGFKMKLKLMALALAFALVGFINSHAADTAATYGKGFIADFTSGALLPWIVWHPDPVLQSLLFVLQGALGCTLILYVIQSQRRTAEDLKWDGFN
jgi:ABC-type cobalt transport system substrate-binding protein